MKPRARSALIRLAESTWPEAETLGRDERSVVVIPLGAIEQHGPHLPLLVDWLGAEELARRVAPHLSRAGYRVVLAPSLPYGVSPLAERWPGTMSLRRTTLVRVIVEVVRNLSRHGFRRFVLANYQADAGHLRAMAEARRRLGGLQVLFAGFNPDDETPSAMVNPRVRSLMRSPQPDLEWHSGELETALVLLRRPELLRRAIARRLPPNWVNFGAALAGGARRFEEIAPGGAGYFGWPAAARARTAERVMRLRADLIGRRLVAELSGRWRGSADGAARTRRSRRSSRAAPPQGRRSATGIEAPGAPRGVTAAGGRRTSTDR